MQGTTANRTRVTDVVRDAAHVIYELQPPLDTREALSVQVEKILHQARFVHCNERFLDMLGLPGYEKLVGVSYGELITSTAGVQREEALYFLRQQLEHFVSKGYRALTESRTRESGTQPQVYSVEMAGVQQQHWLTRLSVTVREETQQRAREDLIFSIAQGLSLATGEAFFKELTSHLAQTLDVDRVLVGEIVQRGEIMELRSLACQVRGEQCEAMLFPIENTPFNHLHDNRICFYPNDVSALFAAHWLSEADIRSYLGVPLVGAGGQVQGVLSILHSAPLDNPELARSLLTIFAVRAAGELERLGHDRKQRQMELHHKMLLENSPNGIYVLNVVPPLPTGLPLREQARRLMSDLRYAECNSAFKEQMRVPVDAELSGNPIGGAGLTMDSAGIIRDFVLGGYRLRDYVCKAFNLQGEESWLSFSLSGLVRDGELQQIYGMLTDVSERMRYTQEMAWQARHDGLTGLPNRNAFREAVIDTLAVAPRDRNVVVMLLDLDGFKEVNDTLGHATGDLLLQQIGPRLAEVLPANSAQLARLGGDEFAVLLQGEMAQDGVDTLARKIIEAVGKPFHVNEIDLCIGGSLGISFFPEHGTDFTALMRCADVAMYQAKNNESHMLVYASELDHHSVRRLSLMMDLRFAIDNEQLLLHYQPIIDLQSSHVIGFEALVRWVHPQHGLLPPGEFIPLIEMTDMMEPLTWWVIETAIKQLALWQRQGQRFSISVNVSTRNLAGASFANRLSQLVRDYCIDGSLLELEITEGTLMAEPEKGREVLLALAKLGLRFSIDDYGTGYSSLAYLKSLPIHTLKIDRTFVSHMLDDPQDAIIVRSTIQLAHNLGLSLTAEGIESAQLIDELREQGCDKGQGFFICRPIPVELLEGWLTLYERGHYAMQSMG